MGMLISLIVEVISQRIYKLIYQKIMFYNLKNGFHKRKPGCSSKIK